MGTNQAHLSTSTPRLLDAAAGARTRFFYRDEYVTHVVEAGARHVFDTEKPRRIRDALVGNGLIPAQDFVPPESVAADELLLVHTREYLAEIRNTERLASLLLLDPTYPWDERLLDAFLFATGGTIAAARFAASTGGVGVNLGGGFHHAQADKGEGFCPIADVAIAIRLLQRDCAVARALIVDVDYHHGNGNAEIFSADESVFTFSIHAGNWCWINKENNRDIELPPRTGDVQYLAALRRHLPEILDAFRPDFSFYVAGSDPFAGDLLGDFDVSEEGMLERDRFVTREIRARSIPMAVVTAGGYGPQSWRIHYNYFRWLLTG